MRAEKAILRGRKSIGVRAGGGEGGCSPPKFWATQIFWAKPVFLRRFRDFKSLF